MWYGMPAGFPVLLPGGALDPSLGWEVSPEPSDLRIDPTQSTGYNESVLKNKIIFDRINKENE